MTDLSLEEFIACLEGFKSSGNKVAAMVHDVLTTECDESAEGISSLVAYACDQAAKLGAELVNRDDAALHGIPDLPSTWQQIVADRASRPPETSSLLRQVGVVAQLWPGTIAGVHNRPGVLSSAIALGMLGGGLGYLHGKAKDIVDDEDNPRRRRAHALAGMLLGAAPSTAYGIWKTFYDKPEVSIPLGTKTAAGLSYQSQGLLVPSKITGMVWQDPYVANHLPPDVRTGITVAMEGARRVHSPYRPSTFITPSDLGVVGMSAGGGYLGGLVAGKMLGALFNVSPATQQTLRRTGLLAGVIRKAVPLIFGN